MTQFWNTSLDTQVDNILGDYATMPTRKGRKKQLKMQSSSRRFVLRQVFYGRGSKEIGTWRRVVFLATKDIQPFEPLMFDYGDDMSHYVN